MSCKECNFWLSMNIHTDTGRCQNKRYAERGGNTRMTTTAEQTCRFTTSAGLARQIVNRPQSSPDCIHLLEVLQLLGLW